MSDILDDLMGDLLEQDSPKEVLPLDTTPIIHAKLGASSAHRWMNCAGSIQLVDRLLTHADFVSTDKTVYADDGTRAHAVGENCLINVSLNPQDYVNLGAIGQEMADAVKIYVDYCRMLMQKKGRCYIEQTFNLEALNPPSDMFGTVDFAHWDPQTKTLEIVDYKHGVGVPVSPVENPQALMYAVGAITSFGLEPREVIVTIIQPRRKDGNRIIWSAPYKMSFISAFAAKLIHAAHATAEPDAPLNPGDWCRFCKARAVCMAHHDHIVSKAKEVFSDDTLPDPDVLLIERLSEILFMRKDVYSWLKQIKEHVEGLLSKGIPVPGWKLAQGRRRKVWVDPEKARKFLISIGISSDISPATAQAALGNTLPRELWEWEPGKQKAVPSYTAAQVFDKEQHTQRGSKHD